MIALLYVTLRTKIYFVHYLTLNDTHPSAGYPLASFLRSHPLSTLGGFNAGGTNASGMVPNITQVLSLVDTDTPESAKVFKSFRDGSDMQLVFSDEFNVDGRTFWPGGEFFFWAFFWFSLREFLVVDMAAETPRRWVR